MRVNVISTDLASIKPYELKQENRRYSLETISGTYSTDDCFISPPWIDSHVHCFHMFTSFGLEPDSIGIKAGVHLLIDAGSAGAETFSAFREHIVNRSQTKVKAFLNISSIGHVTMHEYYDRRVVEVERAARLVEENPDVLVGIKVRSSGLIVEELGLWPLEQAVCAAEIAGCPIMVHMGENPPSNENNLALLRNDDIVTHCFHGKSEPLWTKEGKPVDCLANALRRGVKLDLGHGAASFDRDVGASAISQQFYDFSISTDLHIRNVNGPVNSLADTMTKLFALGMPLVNVIRSVTSIPADRFGLDGWCSKLEENATLFRLELSRTSEERYFDSCKKLIPVVNKIVPIAVIKDGRMISLEDKDE